MIRRQPKLSFQFTDGKRVNLKTLKNEIDRKMLKIQMIAERIPLGLIQHRNMHGGGQQCQKSHVQVQTEQVQAQTVHSPVCSALESKFPSNLRKPSMSKQQRPLIRDRRPLAVKENDFLICKMQDFPVDLQPQQRKMEESCTTMALSSIPEIQFDLHKHKRNQTDHAGSISPIYKDMFKKTDRSMLAKPKTARTIISDIFPQMESLVVSEECQIRMESFVASFIERVRRQPTDHNMRSNIFKKIEEKFKPQTKIQY